jgi:hypothetical protein
MSDLTKIFSPKELARLDEPAKKKIKAELNKHIKASREIRGIIGAHKKANASLKKKLRGTFHKLKSK